MGCDYAPTQHTHLINSANGICRVYLGEDHNEYQCHDNVTARECISLDWIKFTIDGYYYCAPNCIDSLNSTPYSSDDEVSQFFFPDSTCSELCEQEILDSKDCIIIDLN